MNDCEQPVNTLTIFTVPKPFVGSDAIAQYNAINSWKCLGEFARIILAGDEVGTAEAAGDLNVQHLQNIKTNRHGTPLLSDVFHRAHLASQSPFLAFVNCDILLFDDFRFAIERLMHAPTISDFLATGTRTNLKVADRIDFESDKQLQSLKQQVAATGELDSIVCKDYFVFTRQQYRCIPDFAVGRGNWDNWMLHQAKLNKIPVIALGDSVLAVHQAHGYAHAESRLKSYVTGDEARSNQRLAGGRHLLSGSTADFALVDGRLVRKRFSFLAGEFWMDFHRFLRLLGKIVGR